MSNTCPICNRYAQPEAPLCEKHSTTWEIREVSFFGRFAGFGIYSAKYRDGRDPIHISPTRKACEDFFYDPRNQVKMGQALQVVAELGL